MEQIFDQAPKVNSGNECLLSSKVLCKKYKCLSRVSTVPFLPSHLNEAFLQLCDAQHTPILRVNNGRT